LTGEDKNIKCVCGWKSEFTKPIPGLAEILPHQHGFRPSTDPNAMDVDRGKTHGETGHVLIVARRHFRAQCPEPQKPRRARVVEMHDDEYAQDGCVMR